MACEAYDRWSVGNWRPLHFVGEDVWPWWEYRKGLVWRCDTWRTLNPESLSTATLARRAATLFPPPSVCDTLAASSVWKPSVFGPPDLVVVTVGGVYGGSDGPSGLFDYVATVLMGQASVSFLQLDAGHTAQVASQVLRAALEWLRFKEPAAMEEGRVLLVCFSMGIAAAVQVGAEFADSICGLLIFAGQTAGTQRLPIFRGRPALIIHGSEDAAVDMTSAGDVARRLRDEASPGLVRVEIFKQDPAPAPQTRGLAGNEARLLDRMIKHHLWNERWDVQAVVLDWLRQLLRTLPPPGGRGKKYATTRRRSDRP